MDASEVPSSQRKTEAIPCQFAAPEILLGGAQGLGYWVLFLGLIGVRILSVLGLEQGCSGCCHNLSSYAL